MGSIDFDEFVKNKDDCFICRCCQDFKPVKQRSHWIQHITTSKHSKNKNSICNPQTQIENFVINKDGDYICNCCPKFIPVNKRTWLRHIKTKKHERTERLIQFKSKTNKSKTNKSLPQLQLEIDAINGELDYLKITEELYNMTREDKPSFSTPVAFRLFSLDKNKLPSFGSLWSKMAYLE